ncbi:MAG: glutamyl-tRNA reductase [Eubacterium sp.]|nr:glutamyl-tRNA reductase [Eubacterium sp.]
MSIQIIGISHKNAPLAVREMFAFTQDQQNKMMVQMTEYPGVDECVVLSTCNRTELYVYASSENTGQVYKWMQEVFLSTAGAGDIEEIGEYLLFFRGEKAIRHLFYVAAGLDSMVIGEDQILGQVKTAHKNAREIGTTAVYLNTFFRMAVTAAKKVKTQTDLSRTSVSTATLALKVAEDELGTLRGKKVMVIGATGRIGGIVLMNLLSGYDAEAYVTTRTNKVTLKHGMRDFTDLDYADRYEYVDQMDVLISATSSPHYTLTYNKLVRHMTTEKKRVFVDLAVPMDIDPKIGDLDRCSYYNIDDFSKISEENNRRKLHEAESATMILDDCILQFRKWMVFQNSLGAMRSVKDNFIRVTEHKGVDKAFDHFFYWVRENNTPEDIEIFFRCLDH